MNRDHKGHIVTLYRMDETLSKLDLLNHIQLDHSQVPPISKRITKDDLVSIHRLIHLGLGR